eukprot:SAG22_NODE_1841_length_3460_cov_2.136864_2_plen_240_part_00
MSLITDSTLSSLSSTEMSAFVLTGPGQTDAKTAGAAVSTIIDDRHSGGAPNLRLGTAPCSAARPRTPAGALSPAPPPPRSSAGEQVPGIQKKCTIRKRSVASAVRNMDFFSAHLPDVGELAGQLPVDPGRQHLHVPDERDRRGLRPAAELDNVRPVPLRQLAAVAHPLLHRLDALVEHGVVVLEVRELLRQHVQPGQPCRHRRRAEQEQQQEQQHNRSSTIRTSSRVVAHSSCAGRPAG